MIIYFVILIFVVCVSLCVLLSVRSTRKYLMDVVYTDFCYPARYLLLLLLFNREQHLSISKDVLKTLANNVICCDVSFGVFSEVPTTFYNVRVL